MWKWNVTLFCLSVGFVLGSLFGCPPVSGQNEDGVTADVTDDNAPSNPSNAILGQWQMADTMGGASSISMEWNADGTLIRTDPYGRKTNLLYTIQGDHIFSYLDELNDEGYYPCRDLYHFRFLDDNTLELVHQTTTHFIYTRVTE
jgi:hypothetical protein